MQRQLQSWDGEFVVVRYDATADAWVFIAVHSTRLGRAIGGSRMRVYETPADGLRDAQRLAEGMTYKWAGIDFPLGGGKAVIALTRPVEGSTREALLERYASVVESLKGAFGTGADLGVGPDDIPILARKTRHVFGRPPEDGGAGDPGPWTALGVYTAMQAAAAEVFGTPDLEGRTVLIQGLGDVGRPLALRLKENGARLKLADVDAARCEALAGELNAEAVPAERVYDDECDIFAPCAIGAVLNPETVPRLRCRIVAGSANNQLESAEDAARLQARGILYAPDFIANAGGAIQHAGLEMMDMSQEEVEERILAIGDALREIFAAARARGEAPLFAAQRRAEQILKRGPRS